MRARYGILGNGVAPKKVILASLDDLGTESVEYQLPWYGKPSESLEAVYDWMLDNGAKFTVTGNNVPKVLAGAAAAVNKTDNPNQFILDTLRFGDPMGTALILWDDLFADYSSKLVNESSSYGLKTLELTNGLVPFIFEDMSPTKEQAVEEDPTEVEEFDQSTLENMPAAVVKRMAKDKGHDVRTKEDAILALLGKFRGEELTKNEVLERMDIPDRHIISVTVRYSDGMVMEL